MKGTIKPVCRCTEKERFAMFRLMTRFYDNMDSAVFLRDLMDKDYVLVLYEDGQLVGFTTQKLVTVSVDGREVRGVFSGDTIIHKDFWGETELFRVWAQFWFPYAEQFGEFYWFLICKGCKTYRMLPVFFRTFYPSCRAETPAYEQHIIDAYASQLYPDEYNPETGVIEYRGCKDKLRQGVAGIGERELKHPDIAFFSKANPRHAQGNDLACLARIDRTMLRPGVQRILFG